MPARTDFPPAPSGTSSKNPAKISRTQSVRTEISVGAPPRRNCSYTTCITVAAPPAATPFLQRFLHGRRLPMYEKGKRRVQQNPKKKGRERQILFGRLFQKRLFQDQRSNIRERANASTSAPNLSKIAAICSHSIITAFLRGEKFAKALVHAFGTVLQPRVKQKHRRHLSTSRRLFSPPHSHYTAEGLQNQR